MIIPSKAFSIFASGTQCWLISHPALKSPVSAFSAEALATTIANSYSPGKGQLIPPDGQALLAHPGRSQLR
ncbi:hypothetical protein PSG01_05520 [Proteus mirabilis]|uniref:hypothetical protein n=1 Tax=Proteus mirabilis TaxID=584 RepID=UPI00235EAD6D|nr:hypothetical protein [Proteus mirabilis]MDC9777102.1 hypothetical protein [Proteus mirabilis]